MILQHHIPYQRNMRGSEEQNGESFHSQDSHPFVAEEKRQPNHNNVKVHKKKADNEKDINSLFILFCSTISIRGMNKVTRGPKPLRFLWLCFVIITSTILIVASCLLIRDFMLYDVNINVKVELDSMTPFPALTVCHHHPFSNVGYNLWKQKKIMSPTFFNQRMRNLTLEQLLADNIDKAEFISYYEAISLYYQNLPYTEAKQIGHKMDIFLSCMHLVDNTITFAEHCESLENYKVTLFSHHEHFNCYTFQTNDSDTAKGIQMLGLIVSLGPAPDHNNLEQAFIIDTFKQAQGLKVVLHEANTLPNIDDSGMHVEPGKMNEISYRPNKWQLVNTPVKPCIENTDGMIYKDLENSYSYTQHMCLKFAEQDTIMKLCNCIFIFNPRSTIPTEHMPYCGSILDNFNLTNIESKINCIGDIMGDVPMKRKLEKEQCFKRCKYMTFDSSISITKWRATEWHLHWLRQQLTSLKKLKKFKENNPTKKLTESSHFQEWLEYGMKKNLTNINLSRNEMFLKEDNFAYIVLRRESKDSDKKYERLVITQYVLVSRIGGLCSLTVGVTLAFIVELVEFVYLYISKRYKTKNKAVITITAHSRQLDKDFSYGDPKNPWQKRSRPFFQKTSLKGEKNTEIFYNNYQLSPPSNDQESFQEILL